MVGIRDPETAPDLGGVRVERQDALAELLDDAFEPRLETFRLIGVAATADKLHAAPQLADGDGGEKDKVAGVAELFQERDLMAALGAAGRKARRSRIARFWLLREQRVAGQKP